MAMRLSPDYQLLIRLVNHEFWPGASIGTNDPHDHAVMLHDNNIVRLLSDYSAEQWQRLFKAAARQGVLAIAWDALEKLQAGHGVPVVASDKACEEIAGEGKTRQSAAKQQKMRELKIRWGLSVRYIQEVNHLQREALKELAGIFAESGIRVMMLKGLGLADMYPRPEHRECGDLDIYLSGCPDSFEKGNEVMRKRGIPVENDGSKHSKFYYKGIPVENHKNFLNVTTTQVDKDLERELMQILQEQQCGSLDLGGVYVDVPLFLGESGTGKSTHTRLWLENIPGSRLLNDDSPVLRRHKGKNTLYIWFALERKGGGISQ